MTKATNNKQTQQRQYGLLTILSMIVGVVIGSGIFIKNQSLYNTNSSSIISISAWIFITIMVLFMAFAFIEIASISKKKNEPGTLHSWSRDLINPKVGRIVGYFFVFIYLPILVVTLSSYAANELFNTVYISTGYAYVDNYEWGAFFVKFLLATIFLLFFSLMNMLTSKPGKAFQVSGVVIKIAPLMFLSFIGIIIVSMAAAGVPTNAANNAVLDAGAMWDPNSVTNTGMQSDNSLFKLFVLSLPGVMFAYDGFVWAAALQSEAKTKNTFKTALIIGVLLVCFLYVSLSWSIFAIFPYTDINGNGVYDAGIDKANLSVTAALLAIFPNAGWLATMMSIIIVIAIFNTLSGTTILASRNVSSLSEKNMILDSNGHYLQRNKALVPENSAKLILYVSIFWLISLTTIDAINLAVYSAADLVSVPNDLIYATNYSMDIATIMSYLVSVTLLTAGLANRWTNKVEVEKTKVFIPFASIAAFCMFLITVYYAWLTINPVAKYGNGGIEWFEWVNWALNLLVIALIFGVIGFAYWYFGKQLNNANKSTFTKKQAMVSKYLDLNAWNGEEILKTIEKSKKNNYKRKE